MVVMLRCDGVTKDTPFRLHDVATEAASHQSKSPSSPSFRGFGKFDDQSEKSRFNSIDSRAPVNVTSAEKLNHIQTHAMNLFGLVVNDSGLALRVTLVVLEHR